MTQKFKIDFSSIFKNLVGYVRAAFTLNTFIKYSVSLQCLHSSWTEKITQATF